MTNFCEPHTLKRCRISHNTAEISDASRNGARGELYRHCIRRSAGSLSQLSRSLDSRRRRADRRCRAIIHKVLSSRGDLRHSARSNGNLLKRDPRSISSTKSISRSRYSSRTLQEEVILAECIGQARKATLYRVCQKYR